MRRSSELRRIHLAGAPPQCAISDPISQPSIRMNTAVDLVVCGFSVCRCVNNRCGRTRPSGQRQTVRSVDHAACRNKSTRVLVPGWGHADTFESYSPGVTWGRNKRKKVTSREVAADGDAREVTAGCRTFSASAEFSVESGVRAQESSNRQRSAVVARSSERPNDLNGCRAEDHSCKAVIRCAHNRASLLGRPAATAMPLTAWFVI